MDYIDLSQTRVSRSSKPVVVGLYGIPGCGKSFLLQDLKHQLGDEQFDFIEGSEVIDAVTPGGLEAFEHLDVLHQDNWRQLAIDEIAKRSTDSGKIPVVAGHFMFWAEGDDSGTEVWTKRDMVTYTHILYLDVPTNVVSCRREDDTGRDRPQASVGHLNKWRQAEIIRLRRICLDSGILFSAVPESSESLQTVLSLLRDIRIHGEEHNLSLLTLELDRMFANKDHVEIVLVLDGDRTLAAEDTGKMFWTMAGVTEPVLENVFGSSMQYSYKAFRQAMLLYEERAEDYAMICERIAGAVTMYRPFISLLKHIGNCKSVEAIVITCGLRLAWQLILQKEGLSESVKVIGGNRLADGFVVSGKEKRALVERLQKVHGKYVWAFGDSPLDIEMLCQANQAIVIVGEEKTRSKLMDAVLHAAIENGFVARQVVIAANASPRADITTLPLVQLEDDSFLKSVSRSRKADEQTAPRVFHATGSNAADLLMTPMRNASVSGPALREAHRLVGRYLSMEFLAGVVGLAKYSMRHVQGHKIDGFRLANEKETTLVALMRGGEPMAQGINDVFPLAMFVHAKLPLDLKAHHLDGQKTVVLIDSVVNTGRSIVEILQHIRSQQPTIPVVVVAGVVQAQSLTHGDLAQMLAADENLSIITLRLSQNKFTGKKTTDTGNRLFNTTQLD